MKKLFMMGLTVVIMIVMAASALANESPQNTAFQEEVEVQDDTPQWMIVVETMPEPGEDWNEDVIDAYNSNNDAKDKTEKTSLKEIVEKLAALPSNDNITISDNTLFIKDKNTGAVKQKIDLSENDLASDFLVSYDTNGTQKIYNNHGKDISAEIKATFPELINSDGKDAKILLIDPITGRMDFIDIDPENINPETGEVKVKIPYLGVFALVNNVDEINGKNENQSEQNDHGIEAEATPDEEWNEEVKKIVQNINSEAEKESLEQIVEQLAELSANDKISVSGGMLLIKNNNGDTSAAIDLTNLHLSSGFSNMTKTDDTTATYDADGNLISAKLKYSYDQLKDKNPEDFKLLLIDPKTGETTFVKLDPESFNKETGEFEVDLPFVGVFALVEDNQDEEKGSTDWYIDFEEIATIEDDWIDSVKTIVNKTNDPYVEFDLDNILDLMKDVNGLTDEEFTAKISALLNLENPQLVTGFSKVFLTDSIIIKYDNKGKMIPVEVTLRYSRLVNQKADQFLILLIEPETGDFVLIELDNEKFDPSTGEIKVQFPFLGVYALIEK